MGSHKCLCGRAHDIAAGLSERCCTLPSSVPVQILIVIPENGLSAFSPFRVIPEYPNMASLHFCRNYFPTSLNVSDCNCPITKTGYLLVSIHRSFFVSSILQSYIRYIPREMMVISRLVYLIISKHRLFQLSIQIIGLFIAVQKSLVLKVVHLFDQTYGPHALAVRPAF